MRKKNLLENIKINYIYNKDNKDFIAYYENTRREFCNIIEESIDEHVLQIFLEKHPLLFLKVSPLSLFLLSRKRCALYSKIRLGDFETDFAFVHADSGGAHWVFIEIERADVKLFNKKGDMSSNLNHAFRQVTNWQSWIKDNKAYAQSFLGKLQRSSGINKETMFCADPSFIIIIGRRSTVSSDDNRLRVEMCNNYSRLTIMTYDRLLEPFSFFHL